MAAMAGVTGMAVMLSIQWRIALFVDGITEIEFLAAVRIFQNVCHWLGQD